jgi:hypothetical protein
LVLVVLLGVALAAGLVIGCQGSPPPLTATGVVISVDGPNVAEVDQFTLRTADGQLLVFEVDALSLSGGGKAAPHLREHMLSGAPVTVEYRTQDGRTIALRYDDVR